MRLRLLAVALAIGLTTPAMAGRGPHRSQPAPSRSDVGKRSSSPRRALRSSRMHSARRARPVPLARWLPLARTLVPTARSRLRARVTPQKARALFREMAVSRLGYGFPEDYCSYRADVASAAIERAGVRSHLVWVGR